MGIRSVRHLGPVRLGEECTLLASTATAYPCMIQRLTGLEPSVADLDDTKNRSMISSDPGEAVFHEMTVAPQRNTTTVAPLARVAVIWSPFSWTGIELRLWSL